MEIEAVDLVDLESGHAAVLTDDRFIGMRIKEVRAFFQSGVTLVRGCLGSVLLKADHIDGLLHTKKCAGCVKCNVAAADDAYGLSEVDLLVQSLCLKKFQSRVGLGKIVLVEVSQLLADGGADGDQNGVIVFLEFRGIRDRGIAYDLDAGVLDHLHFIQDCLSRDTVFRHTGSHMAARDLLGFEYGNVVALLIQIISSCQSAGTAADHGDFLAGAGSYLEVVVQPDLIFIMLSSKSLEVPDGQGTVDVLVLAVILAAVVADKAESVRERHFLTDDPDGLGILAVIDRADVLRNADMCRALSAAGDKSLLTRDIITEYTDLVTDRTCRAYFHTGSAEAAVCIGQGIAVDHDAHSSVDLGELKCPDSS